MFKKLDLVTVFFYLGLILTISGFFINISTTLQCGTNIWIAGIICQLICFLISFAPLKYTSFTLGKL